MSNRKFGALALCVGACFVAALGAGVKFDAFHPAGLGYFENRCVDGVCKIKYNATTDQTTLHLSITHLLPNTTYGVDLNGDGSGFSDPLAFTTNHGGHGSYEHMVAQDGTPNAQVTIYRWDGDITTIDEMSPTEVRAVAAHDDDDDDDHGHDHD